MSKKTQEYRKGGIKVETNYEGMGAILNSEGVQALMRETANKLAAEMNTRGQKATVDTEFDRSDHNRPREYINVEYTNPEEGSSARKAMFQSINTVNRNKKRPRRRKKSGSTVSKRK